MSDHNVHAKHLIDRQSWTRGAPELSFIPIEAHQKDSSRVTGKVQVFPKLPLVFHDYLIQDSDFVRIEILFF